MKNIARFRHKNINVDEILFSFKKAEDSIINIEFKKLKMLAYNLFKIK